MSKTSKVISSNRSLSMKKRQLSIQMVDTRDGGNLCGIGFTSVASVDLRRTLGRLSQYVKR